MHTHVYIRWLVCVRRVCQFRLTDFWICVASSWDDSHMWRRELSNFHIRNLHNLCWSRPYLSTLSTCQKTLISTIFHHIIFIYSNSLYTEFDLKSLFTGEKKKLAIILMTLSQLSCQIINLIAFNHRNRSDAGRRRQSMNFWDVFNKITIISFFTPFVSYLFYLWPSLLSATLGLYCFCILNLSQSLCSHLIYLISDIFYNLQ